MLAFEEEGFRFSGGDEGVVTRDEGWASCLDGVVATPKVAPDEDPTVFYGDERGDLGKGELGPLESVLREVNSKRSLISLVAQAFFCMSLQMGGGLDFMASVTTEEATRGSIGGGDDKVSLLCHFEVEAVTLDSALVLFFVDLPPWNFTILIN